MNLMDTMQGSLLENFFPAEAYHQRYLEKHPTGYCHIGPGRIAALARYPFASQLYDLPAARLLARWRSEQEEL